MTQRCYYIFYYRNQFYAYTDNKKDARDFLESRKCAYEKQYFSMEDIRQLEADHCDKMIIRYDFELSDHTWARKVPVTKQEKLSFEHLAYQTAMVDIFIYANIPPKLFSKSYQEALDIVGYSSASDTMNSSETDTDICSVSFEPNYTRTFLYLYGDTLKGGRSEIWLSFACSG